MIVVFVNYFRLSLPANRPKMENSMYLFRMLGQSVRVVRNQMTIAMRAYGIALSFEEYLILQIVIAHPYITQQGIVKILQKDKSIVFRQVSVLLSRKLLAQQEMEGDKRKKTLTLSAEGLALQQQLEQIKAGVLHTLLAGVSPEQLRHTLDVLALMQRNGTGELPEEWHPAAQSGASC